MTRTAVRSLAWGALLCAVVAPGARAGTAWIPTVAHSPGVGDSVWRSDLSVLNLCPEPATVELTLTPRPGWRPPPTPWRGSAHQVFQDVVGQLTAGDVTGSLEVDSDRPVLVSSRTYNLSTGGTYGQSLDGVSAEDGLARGESAFLQPLREDAPSAPTSGCSTWAPRRRWSRSACSTARRPGRVLPLRGGRRPAGPGPPPVPHPLRASRHRRRLRPGDGGHGLGRGRLRVGGGQRHRRPDHRDHEGRPRLRRAARHSRPPGGGRRHDGDRARDRHPGYRYFRLSFRQPADHGNPAAGEFPSYLTLLFRSYDAPMVLETRATPTAGPTSGPS